MALKFKNETRLYYKELVLFFLLFIFSCQQKKEPGIIESSILWEDQKAVGITIPHNSIPDSENPDSGNQLIISIENHQDTPILGRWIIKNDEQSFIPLVPFSPGVTYGIYSGDQLIEKFEIEVIAGEPPQVLAIYPSVDTVPENILKMYLQFSAPMKEGESIQNISVFNAINGDTLKGTFLDLSPELWNANNTRLTLWLDPGRIKRGLIPNQELGAPLHSNNHYEIIISNKWKGANGLALANSYSKDIFTGTRDSISPDPEHWNLKIPDAGSQNPMKIEFGESLDAILAIETIEIMDSNRNIISGWESLLNNETVYEFRPDNSWQSGNYIVLIETRLEDLAGNNINRLFDMEITGNEQLIEKEDQVELAFHIK